MSDRIRKIVLAYSGGLDTSVTSALAESSSISARSCLLRRLGQAEELETVHERALATGATQVVVDDLREEFVRDSSSR